MRLRGLQRLGWSVDALTFDITFEMAPARCQLFLRSIVHVPPAGWVLRVDNNDVRSPVWSYNTLNRSLPGINVDFSLATVEAQ